MNSPPIALLGGATGAVGARLLALLLARKDGPGVLAVGRRPPPRRHARLEWLHAELEDFQEALSGRTFDQAFCCLGTTMKRAGSKAAFRAVDLDGVTAFARAARAGGAGFFGLVSAAGADPRSRNFYLRTKGEAEAAVEALGFPSLVIMQPGLLRGEREEFRAGERLGQAAAPLFDRVLLGPLARYRSVAIDSVAAALEVAARRRAPSVHRYDSPAIETLAREP
jgi:uncharacterized protein YbjT (DUF2867 family)